MYSEIYSDLSALVSTSEISKIGKTPVPNHILTALEWKFDLEASDITRCIVSKSETGIKKQAYVIQSKNSGLLGIDQILFTNDKLCDIILLPDAILKNSTDEEKKTQLQLIHIAIGLAQDSYLGNLSNITKGSTLTDITIYSNIVIVVALLAKVIKGVYSVEFITNFYQTYGLFKSFVITEDTIRSTMALLESYLYQLDVVLDDGAILSHGKYRDLLFTKNIKSPEIIGDTDKSDTVKEKDIDNNGVD